MEAKERTEYKTISYKETSYITETSFEEVINIDMSVSQSSVRDYDISSALLNDFHMLQRSDWSWVLILYRIIVRNMLISLYDVPLRDFDIRRSDKGKLLIS